MLEHCLDMPLRAVLELQQKRIMSQSSYRGVPTRKHPIDLWIYFELIERHRPRHVIEIGNLHGGSTLAIADFLQTIGTGSVIAVDCCRSQLVSQVAQHDRIELVTGDACLVVDQVAQMCSGSVMIIEDSSHTFEHTLQVLRCYSPIVQAGGYFIVEDTICHHGLNTGPKPGPFEAVTEFLKQNDNWVADRECESFLMTWNPKGFLRKVA